MPLRAFYKDLKKKLPLLPGLMLLIGHAVAARPGFGAEERLFYRVVIGGAAAGRLTAAESFGAAGRTTSFALELQIRRAGTTQSLGMESRFLESADGEPIEAWSRQRLGSAPVETTYRFTAGGVEVESRQGDNVVRRTLPRTTGWKTPAAAEAETTRAMAAALAGGPTRFSITAMDPLMGPEPSTTVWELEARDEPLELDGRRFVTSRWRQTQDLAPQVPSIVWLDESGEVRRTRSEMAGLDMLVEWTATEPRADGAAPAGPPAAGPEVMAPTLLRPDRPVPRPRALERAVYELRGKHLDLPELGYQRVEKIPGGLRLTVDLQADLQAGLAAGRAERFSEEALAPYRRASIFVNHEDPGVRRLHGRALGQDAPADPAARAELLRRFVEKYLEQKDLASVLATASEVAENASGDCTEHAVLLAALLRADGIPSRVVFGLIYVESFAGEREVFGYHMWTQAYLGGRFADLDATLARPFDAAHISLAASALEDEAASLASLNNAMQILSKASLHLIEPAAPAPVP